MQEKRPAANVPQVENKTAAAHAPSLVSGESRHDLSDLMQARFQQHFLDNQIPAAEAEADRIAASVRGARTPEEVKAQLGEKMGADFSDVRFHTDAASAGAADAMGARAYTSGRDVTFGSGGFDAATAAHELVHTVQQGVVSSTMPTLSAPTGGVQMKPGFFRNLFKKSPKVLDPPDLAPPAAPSSDDMRAEAARIYEGIIAENPKVEEEQTHKLKGISQDERTYEFFQKMKANPGMYGNQYPSLLDAATLYSDPKKTEKEIPEFNKRLEKKRADFNKSRVNLGHTDGKAMLKNAQGARKVADDFNGIDLRHVNTHDQADHGAVTKISPAVMMDAYSVNKEVRINPRTFGFFNDMTRNMTKTKDGQGLKDVHNAGDSNYVMPHELGHIINYQLAERTTDNQTKDNGVYGAQYKGDAGALARVLIADVLASQSHGDEKLRGILGKHVKLKDGQDFTDTAVLQQLADSLKKTGSIRKKSKLMNDLHKGGYTSAYGTTNAMEFFAEAFGDHYHNEMRDDRLTRKGKLEKRDRFRSQRNVLSTNLVQRVKQVYDDEDRMKAMLARFRGTPTT